MAEGGSPKANLISGRVLIFLRNYEEVNVIGLCTTRISGKINKKTIIITKINIIIASKIAILSPKDRYFIGRLKKV